MEMKVQGRMKRIWLDRVRDDIKEKGLMKCTTVLHGGVCNRTSTQHKSGNKTKTRKKKKKKKTKWAPPATRVYIL